MIRGTPLSRRADRIGHVGAATSPPAKARTAEADRLLDTAQANAFLKRSKGFLEKRRSSGIDSPRYLQRGKRGAVLYRVSDLLAWEEERVLTASSDHDDPARMSIRSR